MALQRDWTVAFLMLAGVLVGASLATAQSTTYHLHREASTTSGLFQLKTAGTDASSLTIQSANLKNLGAGEYIVKAFDTQSGVPGLSGTIPSGSTLNFTLWMRKTASAGAMYPRARVRLNTSTGTLLCQATGTTALTIMMSPYEVSCTTGSAITVVSSDRFYMWAGVNMTTGPGNQNQRAELNVENGFDSLVEIPNPTTAPPNISSLNPTSGAVGSAVTLSGTNFGASQGGSTVTFNSSLASITSWTATSIGATVPTSATTGSVVVTVGGQASNGLTFTVLPGISSLNPSSGTVGQAVTINGSNFGASQGTSTVTFNGIAASVTNWSNSSIDVTVPALATTGPVVVTTTAGASNGQVFVVPTGVTYSYDALGRLVGTVDPTGAAATFVYDAVGNLLSIQRTGAGTVSVLSVTPSSGPTGTAVTISGTGYSAVASQNTVLFNGTPATVTASSATQLSVTVPSGASTGSVSVTAPAGTAAGGPFTVMGATAPTISSFTPPIAAVGSAVTINGTNFSAVQIDDRVQFNTRLAQLQSATATALGSTVPETATSGRITVETPLGSATSTDDFFVPPAPYVASDVLVTHRMTVGTSYTITVGTPNKIGLVVFDSSAGQRVSLWGTNGISGQIGLVCDVDVTLLGFAVSVGPVCMEGSGFLEATTLPKAATYTILVDPASTATGSLTLNLYSVPPDITGSIVPGGSPVTVTTTAPGQNGVLTFSGTAGQRIAMLGTDGLSGQAGFNCDVMATIRKPDLSALVAPICMEVSGFQDVVELPATGTYSILVDPTFQATGSLTLALYDVPADVTGSITPGGSSVPITITAPGQNASLTFNGTALQRVSLLAQLTSGSWGCAWSATIRRVTDNLFVGSVPSCGEPAFLQPVELPTTATYRIDLNPAGVGTGTVTVALYDVVDVTGAITINGSAVGINLPTPGQIALLTFSGTTGQNVTASATVTGGAFGCAWSIAILTDTNSVVASNVSCSSGNAVGPVSLPATGTFKVLVDPAGFATGAGNVTLTSP
jgi:YD repeat-containing protein